MPGKDLTFRGLGPSSSQSASLNEMVERKSLFAMWPLLILAVLLRNGQTEFVEFVDVGSFRATTRTVLPTAAVSSRYLVVCCGLCAANNWCTAVNYDATAKTCQLVGNDSLILSADSSSKVSLKVSLQLGDGSSSIQYRFVQGALWAAPSINESRNYTLGPWAATVNLCQIFCESLFDSCYAFQFNDATATCTAFTGNYDGDYLPVDASDLSWSLAYLIRPVDGEYWLISGLYVRALAGSNATDVDGVMDPRRCQQLCEQQQQQAPLGASCQLFAHNVALSLCSVYVATAAPTDLSANDSDANWTSYYKIGNTTGSSSYQYRFVQGALGAAPSINGSRNYTLGPRAATASFCRIFCQSLLDSCYAFQFNDATATCMTFTGNYGGDYLPVDVTDSNWSLAYLVRSVNGPYRKMPGLYVRALGDFNGTVVSGVMDPRRCQQLCEQQQQVLGASCQLFAHNVALFLCTVYVAAAAPFNLSSNDSDANWSSYYMIGSDQTECISSYYFPTAAMTQPQAQAFCNSEYGANLVRVDSQHEQNFLAAILRGYLKLSDSGNVTGVWLGASSKAYPYDFQWTCGLTDLLYTNWLSGEPNSEDEFCVNMWHSYGYLWNNVACSCCNFYFVCEKCESRAC